jgi:integrase
MLSLAKRWDTRPIGSNPCRRVQRTRERARRRYLTPEEAPKLAAALRKHEAQHPHAALFVWLLILSGARCGEIAKAKWSDLHGNVLRLADSKTGPRSIFLLPPVMGLLAKVQRASETITGIQRPDRLWRKVRKEAGCPDLRLHDLRRSFASAGLSAGLTLAQVGELLGHRNA